MQPNRSKGKQGQNQAECYDPTSVTSLHSLLHPTNKTPQQEHGIQAPLSSTEKLANCQLQAKTDVTPTCPVPAILKTSEQSDPE